MLVFVDNLDQLPTKDNAALKMKVTSKNPVENKMPNDNDQSSTDEKVKSAANIRTGACKWFDPKKGIGYIVPDDGGQDLFVQQVKQNLHHSVKPKLMGRKLQYCFSFLFSTKAYAVLIFIYIILLFQIY